MNHVSDIIARKGISAIAVPPDTPVIDALQIMRCIIFYLSLFIHYFIDHIYNSLVVMSVLYQFCQASIRRFSLPVEPSKNFFHACGQPS